MPQDTQDATSPKADERLALAERAAGGDREALLAVIDRFPILIEGRDGRDTARRELQRALVAKLTPCVPELVGILERIPERVPGADAAAAQWSLRAGCAAFVLGEIGAPAQAAVPALIRAMHADPRGVGPFAAPALGQIGGEEAVRELNRVWFSGWDRKLCAGIDWALEHLGARAHPVLLRIVGEDSALERARALYSLQRSGMAARELVWLVAGLIGQEQDPPVGQVAVELLAAGLDDPDRRTRACAALGLARIGGAAAIAPLLAAMPADAAEIEPAVASALLDLLEVGGAGILTACLASEDPELSTSAVQGLGSLGARWSETAAALAGRAPADAETVREWNLLQAVRDREPVLRARAGAMTDDDLACLETAGRGHALTRQAVGRLIPWLRDARRTVRMCAAQALARAEAGPAIRDLAAEPLKAALADADGGVRSEAVRSLGYLGGEDDLPAILPLLADPDWDVRWEAVDALWQIGAEGGIAPLERLARDDPDEEIRARAAWFARRLRETTR